jgi:hypothetical protein
MPQEGWMSHDEHTEARWLGPDELPQAILVLPILMGATLITTVISMVVLFS